MQIINIPDIDAFGGVRRFTLLLKESTHPLISVTFTVNVAAAVGFIKIDAVF